jgi:hypothetical protein
VPLAVGVPLMVNLFADQDTVNPAGKLPTVMSLMDVTPVVLNTMLVIAEFTHTERLTLLVGSMVAVHVDVHAVVVMVAVAVACGQAPTANIV